MRYAMIMAGGAGTRLWPMSRQDLPKQLLPLIPALDGGPPRSLLEISAARLDGLIDQDHRYICTGERYRDVIMNAMGPDTPSAFTDERILGEPAARDTVNAVGFAAAVFAKLDPDAVFVVLTADHLISPDELFRERVDIGLKLVEQDPSRLVTFAIKPTYPATGFGYVEQGAAVRTLDDALIDDKSVAFSVARFVEKPPLHRAQAYVESGHFYWNSGMFVFSAKAFMGCLERHAPESAEGLATIADAWGTDDQQRVLDDVYPTLPKISVDYAVMEPAANDKRVSIVGVEMPVDWLDVGSWPSFGETLTPDKSGNRHGAASTSANTLCADSSDNLVASSDPDHTIALLGCEKLIVVHTPDATLVMPADRAQDVKDLHAKAPDNLK